jgi:hypothetical protein
LWLLDDFYDTIGTSHDTDNEYWKVRKQYPIQNSGDFLALLVDMGQWNN